MKNRTIITWTLLGLVTLLGGSVACSHEIAHSESDKGNWLDSGTTHRESTTYRNPDGSISTEKSIQVTH